MHKILNAMRAQALLANSDRASKRIGLITSYSPDKYMAKVALQPSGVETGWLPVGADWMGNGWGMFAPPGVGAMVEVDFIGADFDVGIIGKRLFNNEDLALSVDAGEFWLVHESGAYFKLTNDGKATFSDGQGATIALDGNGQITSQASQWNHTGPMNVDGNVAVTGAVTATTEMSAPTVAASTDVTVAGLSMKTHYHTGVQTGTGNTGGPA